MLDFGQFKNSDQCRIFTYPTSTGSGVFQSYPKIWLRDDVKTRGEAPLVGCLPDWTQTRGKILVFASHHFTWLYLLINHSILNRICLLLNNQIIYPQIGLNWFCCLILICTHLLIKEALFKASALWVDAFYKSKCLSVCPSVSPSVCVSVHFWGTV